LYKLSQFLTKIYSTTILGHYYYYTTRPTATTSNMNTNICTVRRILSDAFYTGLTVPVYAQKVKVSERTVTKW